MKFRERTLPGLWQSDPYMSQLGQSRDSICFRSDGTIESVIQTQAGPIVATGTYSLAENVLTVNINDAPAGPQHARVRLKAGC